MGALASPKTKHVPPHLEFNGKNRPVNIQLFYNQISKSILHMTEIASRARSSRKFPTPSATLNSGMRRHRRRHHRCHPRRTRSARSTATGRSGGRGRSAWGACGSGRPRRSCRRASFGRTTRRASGPRSCTRSKAPGPLATAIKVGKAMMHLN